MQSRFKLRISYLATTLLVMFPYMIALGAYSQTNIIVLGLYLIVAVLFLIMKPDKTINFKNGNPLLNIWILFILINFVSTIIFSQFDGMKTIVSEVVFTFICYVLCAYIDPKRYFNLLRWFVLFFALLGLFTFFFHIDLFAFKNTLGLSYSSIDIGSGGGISTIFEYRHYYGLYLAVALFVQIIYPFKKYYYNLIAIFIIILNIIATYTRSVWLVLVICGLFWMTKQHNEKLTRKKAKGVMFTILILMLLALIGLIFYQDKILSVLYNINMRMKIFDTDDKYFGGVRLYVLREGLGMIFSNWTKDLWLGGGAGYAMQWLRAHPFGRWGEWSSSIDVQYVTSFMDSGIIGLGLLLVLIKRVIVTFFKTKNKLNILVSFSLIYLIFILFFYDIFGTVTSAFPLWCVCICLLKRSSYKISYREGKELK